MCLLLDFLVFCTFSRTALSHPSNYRHDSSSILSRANINAIDSAPFGRPITLTSPVLANTWNATEASYACQLQPPPNQPTRGPIDVNDCYQVIANLLRRDDIEAPRTFDVNKALATWTYGTCAIGLKPNTTADGPSFDTFPLIDIARAAATVSTDCLSTPTRFHGGAYTVPIGPRAIYLVEILHTSSILKPLANSTELAPIPNGDLRPTPITLPPPEITC